MVSAGSWFQPPPSSVNMKFINDQVPYGKNGIQTVHTNGLLPPCIPNADWKYFGIPPWMWNARYGEPTVQYISWGKKEKKPAYIQLLFKGQLYLHVWKSEFYQILWKRAYSKFFRHRVLFFFLKKIRKGNETNAWKTKIT